MTLSVPGVGSGGAVRSSGGYLISNGSGVLVRVRRDPRGDDEGVYSIPSPARSRRHVIVHDDRLVAPAPGPGSLGTLPIPATGAECATVCLRCCPCGRDGGAGRLPESDSDMGAHHRPDRRRPGGRGPSSGTGSCVGVDHPAGAPGPGLHGSRHSCETPGSVRVPAPSPAAESSQWTVRPCAQPAQARTRHLISWRPWTRPRALSLPRHVWRTSPMRSPRSGSCSSPSTWTGWW